MKHQGQTTSETTSIWSGVMAWGVSGRSAERPSGDPARLEAWCYTDRFSYRLLDRVDVHVHTTASEYSLTVIRDGSVPRGGVESARAPRGRLRDAV